MQVLHDEQVARLKQALDEEDNDKALMVLAEAWQLTEEYRAKLLVPRKTLQVLSHTLLLSVCSLLCVLL